MQNTLTSQSQIAHNTTVYIVDDDPAIRDSLALMIMQERIPVLTFESAEAFLSEVKASHLGCAIIDIRMTGMDGMQLQTALNTLNINLPIIFLTGHGDIPTSVRAIKAGAVDFLTKPVTREKLMASIKSAMLEAEKNQLVQSQLNHAQTQLAQLSDREREVLTYAIKGNANKEIARHLGISHRTVEIHKSKIMQKTGATNLLDLVRIAQEGGLGE